MEVSYVPSRYFNQEHVLMKVPVESMRKIFKKLQKISERESIRLSRSISSLCKEAAKGCASETLISKINDEIEQLKKLKSKMELLQKEEENTVFILKQRINHLDLLYSIDSLQDIKHRDWMQARLNRLLIDYIVRRNCFKTAKDIAEVNQIENLVDIKLWEQAYFIENSLKNRNTQSCLIWCLENKPSLKKLQINLEFYVRLQQFIELSRKNLKVQAFHYLKTYLSPFAESHIKEIQAACGLLSISTNNHQHTRYNKLYSDTQWENLTKMFYNAFFLLNGLSKIPLLYISLSAGLSSLKTPLCKHTSSSSSSSPSSFLSDKDSEIPIEISSSSICPICSTELWEISSSVPYSHHSVSILDPDPVVLPNNRIYGRKKLLQYSEMIGLSKNMIIDPVTKEKWPIDRLKRVFPT